MNDVITTEPVYRFTMGKTAWGTECDHWEVFWEEYQGKFTYSQFTRDTLEQRIKDADDWERAHRNANAIPVYLTVAEAEEWIDHLAQQGWGTDATEPEWRRSLIRSAQTMQRQLTAHTGKPGYDHRRRWA